MVPMFLNQKFILTIVSHMLLQNDWPLKIQTAPILSCVKRQLKQFQKSFPS